MCSGCSGDYAGGFDDTGEPNAGSGEVNWQTRKCGEPDEPGSQQSPEKTRAFEDNPPGRREWQSATVPPLSDQHAGDVCEILVSGTRIIEIRMIEMNGGGLDEVAHLASAQGTPLRQHSAEASAKYYQTRRPGGEGGSDRTQPLFCRAFSRGAAGFIGVNFNRWLRRARKAFGARRAKNSA
jgi:hypothetical protein